MTKTIRWSAVGAAIAGAIASIAMTASSAAAQTQDRAVERMRDWSVFVAEDAPQRYCYAATVPSETQYSQPTVSRGAAFLIIATYPSDDVANELSVRLGYPADGGEDMYLDVDGARFELFAQGEFAFLASPEQDEEVIRAMRRGARARVTATSRRGTEVTDQYSLIGFTAALERVAELCP